MTDAAFKETCCHNCITHAVTACQPGTVAESTAAVGTCNKRWDASTLQRTWELLVTLTADAGCMLPIVS